MHGDAEMGDGSARTLNLPYCFCRSIRGERFEWGEKITALEVLITEHD